MGGKQFFCRICVIAVVVVVAMSVLPTAVASAKPKGDPIKVLVIYPKTGPLPRDEFPDGVVAAAKAMNKKDGIDGRPVQVDICDNKGDPNVVAECARTAVSGGYVAVVNQYSQHGASIMPILAAGKIPSLGIVPATSGDLASPAAFPITGGSFSGGSDLARFIADAGAKKIGLVRPDIASTAPFKNLLLNPALAPLGQEIVNDVPVPTTAPDMAPYVAAALAGGADGLILAVTPQQAVNFIQLARQTNPKIIMGLFTTQTEEVIDALGKEIAGILQSFPLLPVHVKSPANTQFKKDMKAAGLKAFGVYRSSGWLALGILKSVADGLPEVNAAAIFDALNKATDVKTGLTPPLQWVNPLIPALGPLRVFNGCEMAVRYDKKGVPQPITGKFFDARNNKECPSP